MAENFFKSPWEESRKEEPKIGSAKPEVSKKTPPLPVLPLVIGIAALLIIGGGLLILMKLMTEPPQGADLQVFAPQEILVGQPFSLKIQVSNNDAGALRNGKLSLILPPEISFSGKSTEERVYEELVGEIEKSAVINREVALIAVSGTQSISRIQTKFSYSPPGANTHFEKSQTTDLVIGAAAITLDIATPEKALNGGLFETKITINNQSAKDVEGASLSLILPESYRLSGSSVSSTASTTWLLGTLKRGEIKTISITGSVMGQEDDFANITAQLSRQEGDQNYLVGEKTATLNISAPPLAMSIRPNVLSGFASLGEQLQYAVTIKNNAPVSLENITVKTTLLGDLFDPSSINTDGLTNGVNNTITWNTITSPSLRRLGPGETQTLAFAVSVKNKFPIIRQSDKNFTLKVNGTAESPTILPGISSGKTITVVRTETKVAGAINLQTKVYYKDPTAGTLPLGPYPPKANEPTQYTVHWIVRNYASDMTRIEISSFLDPYTRMVGKATSNTSSTPVYNSASGQISWKIDKLAAAQGVLSTPIEAIFRIEATPPSAYATHDITLLRSTSIRANDEFVGDSFSFALPPVLSNLPDDPSPGNVDRTVRP